MEPDLGSARHAQELRALSANQAGEAAVLLPRVFLVVRNTVYTYVRTSGRV